MVRETVTGVRVIRAFGNEAYEEKRSGAAYEDYADNMIRLNRLFAVITPVVWLLMGALMAVILGVGGALSLGGGMAVGQITAVAEYSTLTMAYLIMAASVLTTLPKARACLGRLRELLDTKPAVCDAPIPHTAVRPAPATVEFDHVTFSYEGAEEPVLRDLSFTLRPGQTTAVIGSTGSGKSTLADLLLRLHDIQGGRILLGGEDVRDFTQQELRDRIACVPQKAFLFGGTIAENLRMGRVHATDEELWEALRIAQAEDFVRRPARGELDTPVARAAPTFPAGSASAWPSPGAGEAGRCVHLRRQLLGAGRADGRRAAQGPARARDSARQAHHRPAGEHYPGRRPDPGAGPGAVGGSRDAPGAAGTLLHLP